MFGGHSMELQSLKMSATRSRPMETQGNNSIKLLISGYKIFLRLKGINLSRPKNKRATSFLLNKNKGKQKEHFLHFIQQR